MDPTFSADFAAFSAATAIAVFAADFDPITTYCRAATPRPARRKYPVWRQRISFAKSKAAIDGEGRGILVAKIEGEEREGGED